MKCAINSTYFMWTDCRLIELELNSIILWLFPAPHAGGPLNYGIIRLSKFSRVVLIHCPLSLNSIWFGSYFCKWRGCLLSILVDLFKQFPESFVSFLWFLSVKYIVFIDFYINNILDDAALQNQDSQFCPRAFGPPKHTASWCCEMEFAWSSLRAQYIPSARDSEEFQRVMVS